MGVFLMSCVFEDCKRRMDFPFSVNYSVDYDQVYS